MSIYPFEPKKGYQFVTMDNSYMQAAMKAAKELSWDTGNEPNSPVGAVFVLNGKIILRSSNGSDYHKKNGCERKKLGIVGKDYELCPGCSSKVHCEQKGHQEAKIKGISLKGSDMYMFGHFWCCEPCCKALEEAGVANYYLLKDSHLLFDRKLPTCKTGDWDYFNSLISS